MASSGLLLAALAVVGAAAGDPRELAGGLTIGNITSGYSDQPNCLVRKDGAWLCTVTYNDKPEGSAGEHVITTISTDRGLTWSERYPVEQESKIQHAYSTLFQGPGDAVYVAYVENSDNVTTLNGDYAPREDMYGHFWLRRSLDGGKTWGGAAGAGRSHPADVEWTLLPEGDEGIRYWEPSAPGISEEGHVVPMDDGALYYVFRTDAGVLGGRASYDGGRTFADPTKTGAAVYADGSVVKNPRGPITPRAVDVLGGTTAYVLLYYNNGGRDFNGRNPYWLAPGWQANGTDGATVVWGEPEVALFSTVAADRIGYPDFIVDAEEALYISETESAPRSSRRPARIFAVSADPASRVLSAFVDGKLCDGGKYQTQGWVAMPTGADDPMQHAPGAADATVGPALVGVDEVRFFDRDLKTTEMLGDYRAGL
ncbi:hypothetical protein JL720_742 [Aureococcus anophagefferens]|nr:hypothetical protein JL720_742 [Aureococcus anophagefferens]